VGAQAAGGDLKKGSTAQKSKHGSVIAWAEKIKNTERQKKDGQGERGGGVWPMVNKKGHGINSRGKEHQQEKKNSQASHRNGKPNSNVQNIRLSEQTAGSGIFRREIETADDSEKPLGKNDYPKPEKARPRGGKQK